MFKKTIFSSFHKVVGQLKDYQVRRNQKAKIQNTLMTSLTSYFTIED